MVTIKKAKRGINSSIKLPCCNGVIVRQNGSKQRYCKNTNTNAVQSIYYTGGSTVSNFFLGRPLQLQYSTLHLGQKRNALTPPYACMLRWKYNNLNRLPLTIWDTFIHIRCPLARKTETKWNEGKKINMLKSFKSKVEQNLLRPSSIKSINSYW